MEKERVEILKIEKQEILNKIKELKNKKKSNFFPGLDISVFKQRDKNHQLSFDEDF